MKKPMLFLAQLSVAAFVIVAWHLFTATDLFGNPSKAKFFFATPGDVALRTYKWFAEGTIWYHLGITLLEAILAFAIGAAGGVLIGFWFARKPVLADAESKKPGAAANVQERPSPKPPADDATKKGNM